MPRVTVCASVRILAAALLTIGILLGSPANARGGAACTLLVNTAGNPPASETFAEVGESVFITGTFLPEADVTLTFIHQGIDDQISVVGAASDGSIALETVFEVNDAGGWTIRGTDGSCLAEASVQVTPVGEYTSVGVTSLVCPPEIQTPADLAAQPDACILAVLPSDEPTFPDGYTGPEIALIDFNYRLLGADGAMRDIGFTEAQGGGACDPVELTCVWGWSYHWHDSALGTTQLIGSGFDGYRLGAVEIFGGLEPITPTSVDLAAGSVTWDLSGPGTEDVRFYWFALPAASPSPSALPSQSPSPAVDELPDTAWHHPAIGGDRLAVLFLGSVLAASVLVVYRGRRRLPGIRRG